MMEVIENSIILSLEVLSAILVLQSVILTALEEHETSFSTMQFNNFEIQDDVGANH